MLKLRQADLQLIQRHAEETYPNECCGVLLGRVEANVREVKETVRCTNIHLSPQTRYDVAPVELVRIHRDARERELEIVGFYHSHPDHPAQWSPTDYDHAHWIGCSYLITSVEHGKATLTRSFGLTGTREEDKVFVEESITCL